MAVVPSTQASHAHGGSNAPLHRKQHVRRRGKRCFLPEATLLPAGSTSSHGGSSRCPRAWPSCPRPKRATPTAEAMLPSIGSSTCDDEGSAASSRKQHCFQLEAPRPTAVAAVALERGRRALDPSEPRPRRKQCSPPSEAARATTREALLPPGSNTASSWKHLVPRR